MNEALVNELRATAKVARETVEGPTVKNESKQQLRRLVTLAEKAASEIATVLDAQKAAPVEPAGKDEKKGDDSKG